MSELDKILERYETLVDAMQQLEKEVPQIERTHQELKAVIDTYDEETKKTLELLKSQTEESIQKVKEIEQSVISASGGVTQLLQQVSRGIEQFNFLLNEADEKVNSLTELITKQQTNSITNAELEKRIVILEKKIEEMGGSEKIHPLPKISFPNAAMKFTFDDIKGVKWKKPYGIVIEDEIIEAKHWTNLLDVVVSYAFNKFDVDMEELCEREYGTTVQEEFISYFAEGNCSRIDSRYKYLKEIGISVYSAGAEGTVEIINVLLCDYLEINPKKVQLFYHE